MSLRELREEMQELIERQPSGWEKELQALEQEYHDLYIRIEAHKQKLTDINKEIK